MGASRDKRKRRKRAELRARLADLEARDALRRLEVERCDEVIREAGERERRQKAFMVALADRIRACHEILAHRAERRPVLLTEHDYPTE